MQTTHTNRQAPARGSVATLYHGKAVAWQRDGRARPEPQGQGPCGRGELASWVGKLGLLGELASWRIFGAS